MDPLLPQTIENLYRSAEMVMLSVARPMGFAIMFTAFSWGQINSGLLRLAFAIAVAFPVFWPIWNEAPAMLKGLQSPVAVLVGKEIFIGLLLGFAASLPFEALAGAGAVIDNVRGASASLPAPSGEVTPVGQVFLVVGLWLFAVLGGFWLVVDLIYASYAIWSPLEIGPRITLAGTAGFADFLQRTLLLGVVLGGPLVLLLLATDLVLGITSKLGKRVDVSFLTLSVKNLVAVLALPLIVFMMVRVFSAEIARLAEIVPFLERSLR
jgi:type III secretion protein T